MNSKKRVLMALALAPAMLYAQETFTIEAKVGNDNAPAKAYLLYRPDHTNIVDSTPIVKGKFRFTGPLPEPTLARLIVDHKGVGFNRTTADADMTMVYLEKGIIRMASPDSLKNVVISGSPLNAEYLSYKTFMDSETKQMAALRSRQTIAYRQSPKDAVLTKRLEDSIAMVYKKYQDRQYAYIQSHPDSYISLMTLREVDGPIMNLKRVEPAFNSLSAKIKQTAAGKEFEELMNKKRALVIGQQAPAFTQNDVNDKPVSLADFKGKYVLVDFWASWCKPCRAESPYLVKAYQQLKDKNFTIVSVSLDRPGKKEDWINAIKADNLQWTHVSDLQFWNNEVAVLYGIKSVPQNFLINREGKIIAENLRGEEVTAQLEKAIKADQSH